MKFVKFCNNTLPKEAPIVKGPIVNESKIFALFKSVHVLEKCALILSIRLNQMAFWRLKRITSQMSALLY